MYLVKTPFWLKWLYPGLVWNKSRSEKVIYLTFDDGPIPVVTPFVLKTLKTHNIKATFFCIGDNISKNPEIFSSLTKDGHKIGNHTYNHLKGWDTEDGTYLKNFSACDNIVKSQLFRPPYGRIKKSQIRLLKKSFPGLQIIMWDVLSGDFDPRISAADCFNNAIRNTENGSIVVFHDSEKAFEKLQHALPKAIAYWIEQGYQFRTL